MVLDELLIDALVCSTHSTSFSVVCDYMHRPLLYYDGPEGKWVCAARRLLHKINLGYVNETNTTDIIDIIGSTIENLSILVTTVREEPCEKLTWDQVDDDEDLQLFPLVDASANVIADTIIEEGHPWDSPKVFDFYSLAFKPMPEPALLAYKLYTGFRVDLLT